MLLKQHTRQNLVRALTLSSLVAGGFGVNTNSANAGSCPVSQVTAGGQKPGPTAHKDVTDTVIASIDLVQEAPALKEHKFRLRKLVIQPGGVVAWHSHAERPAIIYVVQGTVTEYASSCSVPIVHHAGDATPELHNTAHWWRNTGKTPAVLISADLLKVGADDKMM